MSRTTLAGLARRAPWGLVGMVALVVMVEGLVDARSMGLYDVDEWAFRATARAASKKVKDAEILCFGDSLVKLSVIPSIIKERTGKRVYNLALSGSQATTSYFLLKRVLASGAKPEAIVVDFNPPLLRVGPRHILTRWGALVGPIEAGELAWWARDADLFGEVATSHCLPSLRGKTTIRTNIMGALANQPPPLAATNLMALRNWKQNDGAQLMVGSAAVRNLSDLDVEKLREGYYPEWKCHPANEQGIDRFLSLATENQIRVFWVLPPMLPAFHDKLARSGIDARHEEFIRAWQSKYPGLVVLDARKKANQLEAFWDPQHLSVDGASAFSMALGDVLRRSIGGGTEQRWVSVPEFKLGPLPSGIEDIDQSRVAVDAASRVRR
jgi:hypothetical protein